MVRNDPDEASWCCETFINTMEQNIFTTKQNNFGWIN